MPLYELTLVLRPMPKKEIVDCLRRTANLIWKEGGVLRKIDYLGHNKLPFAAKGINEGEKLHEGSYFIYHISMGPLKVQSLKPMLKLELDHIRTRFNFKNESALPEDYECTLEEELQPPALRQSVEPLLKYKNVRADTRR